MIFFRVTQNINIKTTDNTLVKYHKFRLPISLENETIYVSTLSDFNDLKKVFENVDKTKYLAKVFNDDKIRQLEGFPTELGLHNINESFKSQKLALKIENNFTINETELRTFIYESNKVDLFRQLKKIHKDKIKIALIGGIGVSISQIIASCTALRILYDKLSEIYKEVMLDIYINASNNTYYTRDKQIYLTQNFINEVFPLSLSIKKLINYDYFIDNSSFTDTIFFKQLNYVDAWLYKFGLDYEKIPEQLKYNQIDLSSYKPKSSLKEKLEKLKTKGKLLLYHPYSANLDKSVPQAYAIDILKQLVNTVDEYIIVSALSIDSKIKDDNYIDLSKESKNLNDFIYIISQMDCIITTATCTYHISDILMIPTVVFFTNENYTKDIKYTKFIKPIEIKDTSKNLSKFIFENDNLIIHKFDSWKKLKVKEIMKLLDEF